MLDPCCISTSSPQKTLTLLELKQNLEGKSFFFSAGDRTGLCSNQKTLYRTPHN
jgi:hypothetical protein